MEPQAKFQELEKVIVSGTLTGRGDLGGVIHQVKYESLSKEFFYQVKTENEGYWSQERYLSRPSKFICDFPNCYCPGEFLLGVAKANSKKPQQLIGSICNEHMRLSIENIMGQCFGTKLWVVVLDLNKKLLYHSYEADQEGLSAAAGWELYLDEQNTIGSHEAKLNLGRGGAREGAGRKQKLKNPSVMSFKVESDLKDKAVELYGKDLPILFTSWLKETIEKNKK